MTLRTGLFTCTRNDCPRRWECFDVELTPPYTPVDCPDCGAPAFLKRIVVTPIADMPRRP